MYKLQQHRAIDGVAKLGKRAATHAKDRIAFVMFPSSDYRSKRQLNWKKAEGCWIGSNPGAWSFGGENRRHAETGCFIVSGTILRLLWM